MAALYPAVVVAEETGGLPTISMMVAIRTKLYFCVPSFVEYGLAENSPETNTCCPFLRRSVNDVVLASAPYMVTEIHVVILLSPYPTLLATLNLSAGFPDFVYDISTSLPRCPVKVITLLIYRSYITVIEKILLLLL